MVVHRSELAARTLAASLAVAFAASCEEIPPAFMRRPTPLQAADCTRTNAAIICEGNIETRCAARAPQSVTDCATNGRVCAPGVGCAMCLPGTFTCDGATVIECVDGTRTERRETCDASAGLYCSPNRCRDLCADARAARSYIGCDYQSIVTSNGSLDPAFPFAIVVANPQLVPATITVRRGGALVLERVVEASAVTAITLPWIEALRNPGAASTRLDDGAYEISSNVPVTLHQHNSIEYQQTGACERVNPRSCFSYTNDASLLLPEHVLTGSAIAISRASLMIRITDDSPVRTLVNRGFVALSAVDDNVRVTVRSSAHIVASADGRVPAIAPGGSATFDLGRGDVVQLVAGAPPGCTPESQDARPAAGLLIEYCAVGREYDLTGTEIEASGRVAVISGHDCAFIPSNRWACDHLEEQMFPLETWGRDVVVSTTKPIRSEPNVVRIISASDGNSLTFDPPTISTPVVVNRGGYVELEATVPFRVVGTSAFLAAQFLVGQDYDGFAASIPGQSGDPDMSLAIPTEQYRSSYAFLAPSTYQENYVQIVAPADAPVFLDGARVTGFAAISGTGLSSSRVRIDRGGVHRVEAAAPIGIVLYGLGSYTSYMVPGGLDLNSITPPF